MTGTAPPAAPSPAGQRAEPRARRSGRGSRTRLRAFGAPALLVALLATAAGLALDVRALTGSGARDNHALTDTAATDRVTAEVSDALARVFTYGPDTLPRTRQAADAVLAGKAARDYATLFGRVEDRVTEQDLSLTSYAVRAGVSELTPTRARLLVFLDQHAQRAGSGPTTTAAQLTVRAELRDDRWRITDITPR